MLGRTSEVDEYTTVPVLHVPSNAFTGTWYVTPSAGTTAATTYGYDQHGGQSAITDAASHAWTATFNLLGQVTAKTDPDTHAMTAMTYDGDGNLLQQANADSANNTVSFTYDALNRKTAQYASLAGGQVAYTSTSSPGNQMASWVYDNANAAVAGMKFPAGHLTTETTYSGAGNGGTVVPYVIQQANFNVFGEPLGEKYTIPAATATAGLSGTYSFSHTWTTNKGLPLGGFYPATTAAGLPSETVSRTYLASPLDLVSGLGGTVAGYAQGTTYDQWGDVLDEQIGKDANLADIASTYDPHTLRLTDQLVTRAVATPSHVDEESYAYDLSGNVTSQASARLGSATVTETQCYQYDGLDQLTQAWTAGDNCATAPTPAAHSQVTSGISAAAAYWTTWNYDTAGGNAPSDVLGELTSQVQHALTGGSDTTTASTFGGTSGGPHALTAAATTGGSASSSTFGYDPAGNMTTRTTPAGGTQALTWNPAGKLTQVSGGPGGTTAYAYAPDGSLLLQANPGKTTLYLDGEQLTAVTAGGTTTVTGARIIALPSGGDVVRAGATTNYFFEVPDPHGTNDLYLNNTAQTPTWRQFTPFGAPRGATTTWTDNRGFLNKPADPATGLTYVGARAYDPITAQFTSPDPVLDPADPQNLNPYLYAEGNPVHNSDPTGLYVPNDPTSTEDPVQQFREDNPIRHTGGNGDTTNGPGTANTGDGSTPAPGSTPRPQIPAGWSFQKTGPFSGVVTHTWVQKHCVPTKIPGVPTCWEQNDEQQFNVGTICGGGARLGFPQCRPASDFLTPDQGADVFLTIVATVGSAGLDAILGATGVAGGMAAAEAGGATRDWAELSGVLRDAAKGKGNFGLGPATQGQAVAAGRAWVGDNATLASDGKTWVSQDGLRQFRSPSYKPNLDLWQANFEWRVVPRGAWFGNGHLDITDLP